MKRWAPIAAVVCTFAVGVPPVVAQQDAVKDILNRAQKQNEKRAVEDLIDKLKPSAPAPGTPAASQPSPATPVTATPVPPVVPPSQPTASPPAAQPPAGPPQVATPQVATPGPVAVPTVTPGASPVPSTPAATPSIPPPVAATPAPTPTAATPVPSVKSVVTPPVDVSRAPEMAERLKLPSAEIEVFFEFDSSEIMPDARLALDTLGAAFADPRLAGQKFVIAGHTDGKGRSEYNLALSQRRSEAVRKYVIDKFKIDPSNLIARGFGRQQLKNKANPLADENRRVQIINWTSQSVARPAR